ncbi:MAG: hypothetical protein PHF86_09660 [Candidatus Nanoarchaeia archaeon]|jgi:hypothetical protein|nr:hypothetical protein [Candidatus Nanoarchaeia archaeon]
MCEIINFQEYKTNRRKVNEKRILDLGASYICLEKCLIYLNMNELPELIPIKNSIKDILKKIEKIGKEENGKR